ncbi:hypothetical protein Aduo_014318 [Ancylostoma duodenale]
MGYNCSTAQYPMIGTTRIFYAGSCLVVIICSLLFQGAFAVACQRMKGWKSNFAYYLIQVMSFFGFLSYIGLLLSYIQGLLLFENTNLAKITGSNYQGSFFSYVIANACLTTHRLFYTLFPIKAQNILTASVLKVCIILIFLFYISYMAFTLSPFASVMFCPAYFFFYVEETQYGQLVYVMNQVSNFVVGVLNISAYCVIFGTLFLKGALTFKKNSEVRMTLHAAVVSLIELLFFLYWEYSVAAVPSEIWKNVSDGYSILIYYDVLVLPYVVLNKRIMSEMKSIFCRHTSTHFVKVAPAFVNTIQIRSL